MKHVWILSAGFQVPRKRYIVLGYYTSRWAALARIEKLSPVYNVEIRVVRVDEDL